MFKTDFIFTLILTSPVIAFAVYFVASLISVIF